MFQKEKAVHSAIYQDIVNNYKFTDGKTFSQMESEIDTIYREKINAYGLSEQGYYKTDAERKERADKEMSEYFDRKLNK